MARLGPGRNAPSLQDTRLDVGVYSTGIWGAENDALGSFGHRLRLVARTGRVQVLCWCHLRRRNSTKRGQPGREISADVPGRTLAPAHPRPGPASRCPDARAPGTSPIQRPGPSLGEAAAMAGCASRYIICYSAPHQARYLSEVSGSQL